MSSDGHLQVRFIHRVGSLSLDVAFVAHAPWTVLFGPSGCGKSTILRVIAGFETPRSSNRNSRVQIKQTIVLDREADICIPAWRRDVRWVAQKTVLFPHMSVEQNLAFGLEAEEGALLALGIIDRVSDAIEGFQLGSLLKKRPHQLSGGERQRVAIARAAVGARGKLLLLDEPFIGLDASIRDQLIGDLRNWLGETPILSVTHDVGEAFLLDAAIIRIADGRVVAQGSVDTVLAEDRAKLQAVLR